MDIVSIAGSALILKAGQTQQTISTSMMKQAADQQNLIANMLAQNSRQAPQPTTESGTGFTFSTYA